MFSVEKGVEKLKMGMAPEALSFFNKAIEVDDVNVEAFVARGALSFPLPATASARIDWVNGPGRRTRRGTTRPCGTWSGRSSSSPATPTPPTTFSKSSSPRGSSESQSHSSA